MTRRSSLNTRLMAGLLIVTSVGLVIMGLVSALVLRGYLLHRVDSQLVAMRTGAARLPDRVRQPSTDVAPSRYVVLRVQPSGQVDSLSVNSEQTRAVKHVQTMGIAKLQEQAQRGRPFSLGPMRAIALVRPRGLLVVAAPLGEIRATVAGLAVTELATGALIIALLALAGQRLIGRGLAPLGRMATTAQRITTGGDLRARMQEDGASEVGRLARAINVMLDRIEQAFIARLHSEAKVREFAADASHELRTPLTTIRGYAELYRQGAIGPDELADAMRRIEDEANRMSSLVGELLELARLDRGATSDLASVDLTEIARDAVADATAVEPDRPLILDAPQSLVAVVDESRIRQVLANLLANIRVHTPPQTPATVRLARAGDGVYIEVEDAGPGMSPGDAARAFDRFHRAEHTPGGGSGLGLAIVAAIAAAHGGRAYLRSEPGRGTTVRVELPAAQPAIPSSPPLPRDLQDHGNGGAGR